MTSLSIWPSGVTEAELSKMPTPVSGPATTAAAARNTTARINDLRIMLATRTYRTSELYIKWIHNASLRLEVRRTGVQLGTTAIQSAETRNPKLEARNKPQAP